MSRALYRGATPERVRTQIPSEEPGSPTKVRDEQGNDDSCFPHSMRSWIKQNFAFATSSSSSSSSHKYGPNFGDLGSKLAKGMESPGGPLSLNSSSGTGTGPSCCSCLRKISTFSLLTIVLLCLAGALALVTVGGLNRPVPRVVFRPHNYRRAQLLAWKEVLRGGMLGRGALVSNPPIVETCPSGMEDYIPCYDATASLTAGLTSSGLEGEGIDATGACGLSGKFKCLVPAPKHYRILSKWPDSSEGIWRGNVRIKEEEGQSRFLFEENLLRFPAEDPQLRNDVGSHVQSVAEILGLSGVDEFAQAKIRSVLDIGCGVGNVGAYLWGYEILTMCVAPYEKHGGQVQITLERGFPAMVGSFVTLQLPYPSSSFDLIHCADCGMREHLNHDLTMLEMDRLLRVGGYFVWVIQSEGSLYSYGDEAVAQLQNLTSSLGWELLSPLEHDSMVVWQKRAPYIDVKMQNVIQKAQFCEQNYHDGDWAWRQRLRPCITSSPAYRQVSVQDQLVWPARLQLADTEPPKPGLEDEEALAEPRTWTGTVADYWSLLTPNIFSDHPKRLGDEDVGPNSGLVRNMMDMNAGHGELNAALLMSGKPVWVMNVVPTSAVNTLPFIFDRGLIGTAHDWCEPFPSYPRTYDFLHASDLLSQLLKRPSSCGVSNLFLEMDRILRPEGWVFIRDEAALIQDARAVAIQMRWESRLIEVTGDKEQRLLVCQKPFWKA